MKKVTLYPVAGLTSAWEDEPFDLSQLPASILPNCDDRKRVVHVCRRHLGFV